MSSLLHSPNARWSRRAAAHMHESCGWEPELVDRGIQQPNKEDDWHNVFMYFENTKLLNLNVFK